MTKIKKASILISIGLLAIMLVVTRACSSKSATTAATTAAGHLNHDQRCNRYFPVNVGIRPIRLFQQLRRLSRRQWPGWRRSGPMGFRRYAGQI